MPTIKKAIIRSVLLLLLFLLAAWFSARPFFDSPSPIVGEPVAISDPQGLLSPQEAVQQAAARIADPNHAIGITTRGYWWVAQVANPNDTGQWVVHVGNTAIERVQFYLFEGETVLQQESVDLLAKAREGLPAYHIGHQFSIALPPGSRRTVVLRLETPVAHTGLIFIKPAHLAAAEARFHMVAIWAAAGAIASLIFYNLFLGISLKLPTYLYYVGHASAHLLYLLTALGMVGAGLPILERYLALNIPGIGAGVFFGALFVYTFLDLPTLSPRLARIYRYFLGAMLLSPLLALVLAPHQFLTLIRSSHLVLAVLVIAAALTGVAKRKHEARYILIGWGGMVAMTAKGMLGVLGLVELTIDAGVWALWAVLFEMFFLSLALADRVRRLRHEKEAAQAANAAKSAFLANMSHEIRTPLNGVLGMVDVLRRTSLDNQQHDYLENIHHCSTTLLGMLNNVLDYSRAEAGQVKLEETEFNLRRLLDGVVFLITGQAEQKRLRFRLSIAPDVPTHVVGDPGRLRQVLLNLLGNAVKFTEKGEVQLTVECLQPNRNGSRVRFTVSDTGIGIDAEAQRHLFARFHQADSSIARRYGGTGLGLAIVKELVTLMGGVIGVESHVGRGTRFQVEVPLLNAVPRGHVGEPRLPRLNVLVVDDDAINRLVISELLTRDGHRVSAAESGAVALERVAQEIFDVVFMDLAMPEMDGLEVTRRLRAARVTIPVIGLTAHILPEHEHACVEAGMNTVVNKPIQPERINQLLAAVLERPNASVAA